MKFSTMGFILPREDCTEAECGDCLLYEANLKLRFAIGDIANNSSFPGTWAGMLVADFVESGGEHLIERIRYLQQIWRTSINWESLKWNEEAKAKRGDNSTFLGLTFFPSQDREKGVWKATAIGDSCLFHIRDNDILHQFPLQKASEFNDFPTLSSSVDKNYQKLIADIKFAYGEYRLDDIFILATDALAEWFLRSYEKGEKPWIPLIEIESIREYREFIHMLRICKNIKDDDTSYLKVWLRNVELVIV